MLKELIIAGAILHAADAQSTNMAITRGAHEVSGSATHALFGASPAAAGVWAQQGGESFAFAWLETKLRKTHPRLVWAAVAADVVAEAYAVHRNVQNVQWLNAQRGR